MKQRRKEWAAWTVAFSLALLAAAPTAEAQTCDPFTGKRIPLGPCALSPNDFCCGTLSPSPPFQIVDSNNDDFGNHCDGDFNQDCVVSSVDLLTVGMTFGTAVCDTPSGQIFDLDGVDGSGTSTGEADGTACGLPDYNRFMLLVGTAPDP